MDVSIMNGWDDGPTGHMTDRQTGMTDGLVARWTDSSTDGQDDGWTWQ